VIRSIVASTLVLKRCEGNIWGAFIFDVVVLFSLRTVAGVY
jgi:hypothetical protein